MALELFASASRLVHGFLFLLLLWLVSALAAVAGGNTAGFLSIDCGIGDGYNYTDEKTTIPYISDVNYIDTGTNHNISSSSINSDTTVSIQERTLRSFPLGKRNCYSLPVQEDQKYLVRATFLHGNYDGGQIAISGVSPVIFDLYLGVNLWKTVNISNATIKCEMEVITVALADYISICLVNKGLGIPFISSLELRPLKVNLYPNATASVSLAMYLRNNFARMMEGKITRFPDDPYDRTWSGFFALLFWDENTTSSHVRSRADDLFEVPSAVLQTAASNHYMKQMLYYWDPPTGDDALSQYYVYLHFAELQSLAAGQSRVFDVYLGNRFYRASFSPQYLVSSFVYTTEASISYMNNFSLRPTPSSTLPATISALEIYSVLQLTETATGAADVYAIRAIKQQYKLSRNWEGDPCAPKDYLWDGLGCDYSVSGPPRITSVNLSYSELIGTIADAFANLKSIKYLDLSHNNLTGPVPDFLAELPSLEVLNLTNNQLSGSIPSDLLVKSQKGSLALRTEGNPYLCTDATPCVASPTSEKKKIATPVIVILCIFSAMILLLVTVIILWRMKKLQCCLHSTVLEKIWRSDISARPHYDDRSMQLEEYHDSSFQFENRQFTYGELKTITNNFGRVLGKGGFGIVYHGCLDDGTEVAVKMRDQSSSQGIKEFLAEVQHLTRVHHRNLVSMVGYCKDRESLAVVYKYMSRGTLREHLQGKIDNSIALSWGQRVLIAVDAAQGLEYLHKMCQPPVIHRDVTTGNILLSEKLEAKIADFGLSKALQSDLKTHVSTAVVGTPGYLDPEYHATYMLSEKSDVYSFGVVLLELITGRPPVMEGTENAHIVPWVLQGLSRGNIEDIVDPKLQGEYNVDSVWKCADVALKCTSQGGHQRPTMPDVVMRLKESLELEAPSDGHKHMSLSSAHTAIVPPAAFSNTPVAR